MVKEFDISQKKTIMVESYKGYTPFNREVCPDCADHPQLNMKDVNRISNEDDTELDCKNLFIENGKIVGQCCCYSMVHHIDYMNENERKAK